MPTPVSTGSLTIADLNDGLYALLSSETGLVHCDSAGTPTTPLTTAPLTTMMTVYKGNSVQTGFSFTRTASNGITSSVNASGVLSVTGLTVGVDSGWVDITASKSGEPSITKRYVISKVKQGIQGIQGPQGIQGVTGQTGAQGPQGTPAIMGLLTNDSHVVPTDSAGNNGNFNGCNTTVKILVGTSDDSANWSVTAIPTNVTGTLSGKTYTVETLSADVGYVDFSATRSGYPTIPLRFTVTRSKQGSAGATGSTGASATAYWLVSSVAAIKKSIAGAYTPTTITFSAKSQTGTGSPANYAGRFKISESANGSTWTLKYTSYTNEASKEYTPSAGIVAINCELYLAGGVTTLIDQEIVPIVSDGATGPKGEQGLQGLQGPQGNQGIQGPKGADGLSSYTHIAYATGVSGENFNVNHFPSATYIGMYVDNNPNDSTSHTSYNWSLIKGADGTQGIPGPKGSDGLTAYLHTAWANNSTGTSGFSTTVSDGKLYIGTYTDHTQADSTDPTKYKWVKIKGETGSQGPSGTSITSVEVEYAISTSNTTAPTTGWSTASPDWEDGKFMWSRVKTSYSVGVPTYTNPACITGGKGDTGEQGPTGDPGQLLELNADTGVILLTARGVLVTAEIKLTIVSANIPIADVTIFRSDAGVLTKIDDYHYTLDCSTVMTDTITVDVTATYLGKSYSSMVSVTKYVDPNKTAYNFGGVTVVPSKLPDGTRLLSGDYFLWVDSNTPAGSTVDPVIAYPDLVKGEVYEYDGTWRASTNRQLYMNLLPEFMDIANTSDDEVIGNAIIKNLVTIEAFIQKLGATFLKLNETGCIHSDYYLRDGTVNPDSSALQGVYINAEGEAKFYKGFFSEVTISGDGTFSGDISNPLFRIEKGYFGNSYTLPAYDAWDEAYIWAALTSVPEVDTRSWGAGTTGYSSSVPCTGTWVGTWGTRTIVRALRMNGHGSKGMYAWDGVRLWFSDGTDYTFAQNQTPGEYMSEGVMSISSPNTYNSVAEYVHTSKVVNVFSSLPAGVEIGATGTMGVYYPVGYAPFAGYETRTVIGIIPNGTTLRIKFYGGTYKDYSMYAYTKDYGSLTLIGKADLVEATTITPKTTTTDIGTETKKFRDGWFSGRVWGAVFN